ncbi:hypothetical protein CBD41_08715 [bacterium TMED181]|nr:MAG: hypothetical protein CBD41_08715 [bacterium TMED181]
MKLFGLSIVHNHLRIMQLLQQHHYYKLKKQSSPAYMKLLRISLRLQLQWCTYISIRIHLILLEVELVFE